MAKNWIKRKYQSEISLYYFVTKSPPSKYLANKNQELLLRPPFISLSVQETVLCNTVPQCH